MALPYAVIRVTITVLLWVWKYWCLWKFLCSNLTFTFYLQKRIQWKRMFPNNLITAAIIYLGNFRYSCSPLRNGHNSPFKVLCHNSHWFLEHTEGKEKRKKFLIHSPSHLVTLNLQLKPEQPRFGKSSKGRDSYYSNINSDLTNIAYFLGCKGFDKILKLVSAFVNLWVIFSKILFCIDMCCLVHKHLWVPIFGKLNK